MGFIGEDIQFLTTELSKRIIEYQQMVSEAIKDMYKVLGVPAKYLQHVKPSRKLKNLDRNQTLKWIRNYDRNYRHK